MLEGKALVVAVMMLTAAPIAATDQGQAFLGDVTYEIGEVFNDDDEETKAIDKIRDEADKELLLTDDKEEVDCLTLEQWKETFVPEEKVDEVRKEKEGARGDSKEDDKKEDYSDKKDWTNKEAVTEDDCLTEEEWVLKFESDKEEPCFTFEDIEEKMKGEKKHHKKGWDRIHHGEDKDWDREDNVWAEDEEFRLYLAELSEACDEGDEEACDELLEIREELVEDRDEEEREERDEDDGARGDDETDEDEEFRLYLAELAEACDEGDEEACDEFREIMAELVEDREENYRDRDEKDLDEGACLTMDEWKEVLGDDKKERYNDDWDDEKICIREDENGVIHYDCGNDRKEKGPHRDAFVREMLAELEYACEEENNEEACAELEEMFAEFEEREGECDKERDDEEDESEQEESEEDETDEDESNDEDSEE